MNVIISSVVNFTRLIESLTLVNKQNVKESDQELVYDLKNERSNSFERSV